MTSATRRRLLFVLKLAVSAGILVFIFKKILERENASDLWTRLSELSWVWIIAAVGAQLAAIATSVVRWDRLLVGQGIRAPWRHLLGSFMVGRFFGAFTPGGWTGLNGYRLYDIAQRTGKTARSTATIGIEMVLGQLAFGAVVIAGSIFGFRYIGLKGVLLVDGFFVAVITVAILLLSRPALFRWIAGKLPKGIQTRIQTLVDAVCAYQGKTKLVIQAALLGMGTHAFNNLIYVSAARALGVDLSIGEVFFVSSMQIFATLVPISVGGVGLREAAAVSLYTIVGVPAGLAVLIPIVGIAVEYAISSFGGVVFVARQHGYDTNIEVEDAEREDRVHSEIEVAPPERRPSVVRGAVIGLGAGVLAGALIGVAEAAVVMTTARGGVGLGVLPYGAVAYGLLCAAGGTVAGAVLAWSGRWLGREAVAEPKAFGRLAALMVAALAFALGAFRIRRDVFEEQMGMSNALMVVGGCLAASAVLYVVLSFVLRLWTERRGGQFMLRAWGSPALVGLAVGALALASTLTAGSTKAVSDGTPAGKQTAAPTQARNVLFIVVDTLRADHLPHWGYEQIETPNLQSFAKDAIRFDKAFVNSSWTRPSFATILTSRYPASHRVMAKRDALPDELVTMPEALGKAGYETAGFVTNYNVAPFFNFHQGFDYYRYLEPEYVLGANDAAAKLLFVQALKRVVQKAQGAQPGSAYRDAQTVNRALYDWLDRKPESPFFMFVGYMDPHDPYFEHPYSGVGYSRAAHQHPDPDKAPWLRDLYDQEIVYWDKHFGKLIEDLKQRGLYDEMTIVVTSDHGEEFMDHGGFWHGKTLYDEQIHVPLYVKLPHGQRGGTVVEHWVQSVDFMPTVLRLNGVEVPDDVQGGDLFEPSGEIYAQEEHEGNVLKSLRTHRGLSKMKLITANEGNPRGLPPRELFRIGMDPNERVNLADQRPVVLKLLEQRLAQWTEQAQKGAVDPQKIKGQDPDAVAKLRALGYAGAED